MPLKSPRRLLTGLSIAAVLFAGGFFIQEAVKEHSRALNVLQRTLQSQAILLAEHAELTLSTANRLLDAVEWENSRERLQVSLANSPLYQHILSTPQLAGLIVADAMGAPLFTAKRLPLPHGELAGQAFFQAHQADVQHYLGEPIALGNDQRRYIPVSQRLADAEGNFAGVAVVLLDAAYLRRFYAEVSQQLQLRIGMLHSNGALLTLYPTPIAELPSAPAGLEALFASRHAQSLVLDSPLDGSRRIAAFRNLDDFPVVVTASYPHAAFMAGLMPVFLRSGLMFLLFAAGVGGGALLVNRAMRDAYRAREAQLGIQRQQQETLQLCHAIARNLPNGRVFVLDEAMRYVFVEGQHWQDDPELQPQTLMGQTIQQVYPADVSRALEALVRSAFDGSEAESEIELQGRVYKAFATPLADDDGKTRRCLLLSQDITQFKEDQQALEALNQKLHRLASRDGLLGIANRREFERVLEHEWQRGLRESQPLGLLMIDVDHFKQYNDSYGHPAGDACLQQIAALLDEALKRPADLVARYGGEEMVILLPNTDREGALHVAEQVHALLATHHLPFEVSPTFDRVTVSIGVASSVPAATSSPATLIDNADAALYAAKENGRNRTEVWAAEEALHTSG